MIVNLPRLEELRTVQGYGNSKAKTRPQQPEAPFFSVKAAERTLAAVLERADPKATKTRKHMPLKKTPTQAAGMADHQWALEEVVGMMDAHSVAEFEAAFAAKYTQHRTTPKTYAPAALKVRGISRASRIGATIETEMRLTHYPEACSKQSFADKCVPKLELGNEIGYESSTLI